MWLLMNIGCIECGVSSNVVGIFKTEAEAQALADILLEKADWREGGQNDYRVFPLAEGFWVKDEYLKLAEGEEGNEV